MGILDTLTLILVTLKFLDLVTFSWLVAFSPLLIAFAISMLFYTWTAYKENQEHKK